MKQWRFRLCLFVLLGVLVIIASGAALATNHYFLWVLDPPTTFYCSPTFFMGTDVTYEWDLTGSGLTVVGNEYINGELYTSFPSGINSGSGTQLSNIISFDFPSTDYPYTWSRHFVVEQDGNLVSESIFDVYCEDYSTATVTRNEIVYPSDTPGNSNPPGGDPPAGPNPNPGDSVPSNPANGGNGNAGGLVVVLPVSQVRHTRGTISAVIDPAAGKFLDALIIAICDVNIS